MLRKITFIMLILMMVAVTIHAQGVPPSVAFINNSGQLVVVSADGNSRWIATNPGEALHANLGYTWSPNGTQIFYAVDYGNVVSLRVGDITTGAIVEIGQASGELSGGEWTNDNQVLVASNNTIVAYPSNTVITTTVGQASIVSPYASGNTHTDIASLNPGNNALFYHDGDASVVQAGGNVVPTNTIRTGLQEVSIWSSVAPLVAYSGFGPNGNGVLAISNANSGETIFFPSSYSTPALPIAWIPNTNILVFKDDVGNVRAAAVDCLQTGCDPNILATAGQLLPATATDLQVTASWVLYRENNNLMGVRVDANCLVNNTCTATAGIVGANIAPRTSYFVNGTRIFYTAFTQDAQNPSDREVRVIDTLCAPDCPATILIANAVGGAVSSNGTFMLAAVANSGIHVVNTSDLSLVQLSNANGQAATLLDGMRWNA